MSGRSSIGVPHSPLMEANVSPRETTRPAFAEHTWRPTYFSKFTYCSHCTDFIWGLTQAQQDGLVCEGTRPPRPGPRLSRLSPPVHSADVPPSS